MQLGVLDMQCCRHLLLRYEHVQKASISKASLRERCRLETTCPCSWLYRFRSLWLVNSLKGLMLSLKLPVYEFYWQAGVSLCKGHIDGYKIVIVGPCLHLHNFLEEIGGKMLQKVASGSLSFSFQKNPKNARNPTNNSHRPATPSPE